MKQAILLLCFSLLLTGCASKHLMPISSERTSADFVLEEDEKRLWNRSKEVERKIAISGIIYPDKELDTYLNGVAKKLQPPQLLAYLPFQIVVIQDCHLNAFSLADGALYLHTGILAKIDNEAQLATLLAHEMTHATHRHMIKSVRDIKNKSAFLATIDTTIGGIGAGLPTLFGAIGTYASVAGYSRELETEADLEGLKLVKKAGYDLNESPVLFKHLKQELEDEKIKEPFFFGTHPRLQERIDNYEAYLKEEHPVGGIKNKEIFLKKTYRLIYDNTWLDLKAGRFKSALTEAQKYLVINPGNPKASYLLGEVLRQRAETDDSKKAKEYYQKAISMDPSYPEPYRGMGMIFYKEKEKASAKKYFNRYLSLAPRAQDAGFIKEYIKTLE